jgi:hypothetical protein
MHNSDEYKKKYVNEVLKAKLLTHDETMEFLSDYYTGKEMKTFKKEMEFVELSCGRLRMLHSIEWDPRYNEHEEQRKKEMRDLKKHECRECNPPQ